MALQSGAEATGWGSETADDWKDYIEKTSQVDTFLTGAAFDDFIKQDLERVKQVAGEQGWLVK